MKSEVVEYTDRFEGWSVRFTVSRATGEIGMARSRLRLDGERAIDLVENRRMIRIYTYPNICAAVVTAEALGEVAVPWASWPPDLESFFSGEIPEELTIKLEEAAYRLNPHWLPGGGATEDPKARAPESTSGSTTA